MPEPYRKFGFAFFVSLALAACVFSVGPVFGEAATYARLNQTGSTEVTFTRLEATATLQNRDLSTLKARVRLLIRDLDIKMTGDSHAISNPREFENRLARTGRAASTGVIELHIDAGTLAVQSSDPTILAGTVMVDGLAQPRAVPASIKVHFQPVIQPTDSPFGAERLVMEGRLQLSGSLLGGPDSPVAGEDSFSLTFRLVMEPVGKSGREFVARKFPGL